MLCRRIENHKLRKLLKLQKNELFWIWYMSPKNFGGIKAKRQIENTITNLCIY